MFASLNSAVWWGFSLRLSRDLWVWVGWRGRRDCPVRTRDLGARSSGPVCEVACARLCTATGLGHPLRDSGRLSSPSTSRLFSPSAPFTPSTRPLVPRSREALLRGNWGLWRGTAPATGVVGGPILRSLSIGKRSGEVREAWAIRGGA